MHFDRPKTTFREGNVFTGVCQSVHSGGGSGSTFPSYPPATVIPGTIPPGPYPHNHTPRTIPPRTVPRRTVPSGDRTPQDHTYPTRNHKSGRYASYWNAALLSIESTGGPSRKERSRPFCAQTTARHH